MIFPITEAEGDEAAQLVAPAIPEVRPTVDEDDEREARILYRSTPEVHRMTMTLVIWLNQSQLALLASFLKTNWRRSWQNRAPTTHFVKRIQTVLFRGAGIEAAWPQFAALALIGTLMFVTSLVRFRRTLGSMA